MRVPRVLQADSCVGPRNSVVAHLDRGGPVQIDTCSFPVLPLSLRKVVSDWPQKSFGTKHPSWLSDSNILKPSHLEKQQGASDFSQFLKEFQSAAEVVVKNIIGFNQSDYQGDRVSWRPYELSTVSRRWNARDDLFHIDSFSSRPTQGRRILRMFFNASDRDEIIWSNSIGLLEYLRTNPCLEIIKNKITARSESFDQWLGQIHDLLKKDEAFQETAPRSIHRFKPGSAWLVLTDASLHSYLRGDWLMDISWFVSNPELVQSQRSPVSLFKEINPGSLINLEGHLAAA